MADYVVKGESLTAVADAIREKTGETDAMGLEEMPARVDAVFEAGKKSGYDAFWDAAQDFGRRVTYVCGFAGHCWTDENYNPKYPITATDNANYLFWNSKLTDTKVDIYLPVGGSNNSNTFASSALVTIRKLIVTENTKFSNTFGGCSKLENITFEGVIGSDMTISAATKLTHASLMSILNALKDYSGSGTTYTVTLGAENLAKLTDEEKMIAVGKGWVLDGWTPPASWEEGAYCDKCWIGVYDANGRCPECGYSVPLGKRVCTCGGDIGENCVCADCGKVYHASEGPCCVHCGAELCQDCGSWPDASGNCPSCSGSVSHCENCGSAISEDLGGCTNPACPASPYYDHDDSGMDEPEVDTSEFTVQGSSFVIDSWEDEDGNAWGFDASPGYFWCDAGVNFAAGDVISFAGDDSGTKYVVTEVNPDFAQGDEYAVHFAGTYTPAFGDTVTKWLKP